jgi:PAS domain S-box-containing protein
MIHIASLRKFVNSNKMELGELFLFLVFLLFLIIIRSSFHLLFHTVAEFYVCMISFALFFITLYSAGIRENRFIIFLGIGYFFISILDMLHIFLYSGVSIIFEHGDQSIVVQFWISARYLTAFTLLTSAFMLLGKLRNINFYLVVMIYTMITAAVISSILYFKVFPACYAVASGLTQFKKSSELAITIILALVVIIYLKLRMNMDKKLFYYMECHLVSMAVSEMLFTSFFSPYDWTNIWAHMIRVISYYFLYKGIIQSGLKRPYAVLYNEINKIDRQLHITSKKLAHEQEQRNLMEEILIKNENCYELIINNSSDAIVIIHCDKIICTNDRAARLFEVDDIDYLVGRDWLSFIYEAERAHVSNMIRNSEANQACLTPFETIIVTGEGVEIEVEICCFSLIYQNKLSYINVLKDISPAKKISALRNEIKNHEKQLNDTMEYNKLQSEFFSNISHEFKTPLNVILAAIQIMTISKKHTEKHLRIMKQNCYRLLRLVSNIIDLTKFDTGYSDLVLRNHNIVGLMKEVVLSVNDYIISRGLDIVFRTSVEQRIIALDSEKIERIMLNLLSNSIKFTDRGGTISVTLDETNEAVYISVRDTGMGIPEDKLNTILDRFSQVDKTLSRNGEGSGLGLAIVKKLVDMHQGTLTIHSVIGVGSEFIVELPLRTVKDENNHRYCFAEESRSQRVNVEFSDICP